jgi:hypothetical protein
LLGSALLLAALPVPERAQTAEKLIPVQVEKILLVNEQPAVVLANEQEHQYLLVFVDHFMAQSIQMGLMDLAIERPLTHDLIGILLRRLGAEVTRVTITELRDSTYFAVITMRSNGSVQEIDARPSDALAIAVRLKTPVFAARGLMSNHLFPEGGPAPQPLKEDPGTAKQGA